VRKLFEAAINFSASMTGRDMKLLLTGLMRCDLLKLTDYRGVLIPEAVPKGWALPPRRKIHSSRSLVFGRRVPKSHTAADTRVSVRLPWTSGSQSSGARTVFA